MLDIRIAETAEEREAVYRFRYRIYVDEMGRYQQVARHADRQLVDPEDESSWIAYARDGGEIVGAMRITWGGAGLSNRQLDLYGLRPFLVELPPACVAVGERAMVAPALRGGEILDRLGTVIEPLLDAHGVLAVFGACEPHLLSRYFRFQRPYGTRNINSEEAGYLIPLVLFRPDETAFFGLGGRAGLPRCIQAVVDGQSTVRSPLLTDPSEHWRDLEAALAHIDAPIFEDFTTSELRDCLERSNIISCAKADRILKRGGIARNVFVVLSGELAVRSDDGHVATLGAGDVFGETAYLLETTRARDVDVVSEEARVLCLSERRLRALVTDQPATGAKLLGNLAKVLGRRLAGV